MSGFSISRLSHRLAIQDRPPREKSQSALNKNGQDEVEQEETSSLLVEHQETKTSKRRRPSSERIDLCNVRNALFDIDYVLVLLNYIQLSLQLTEEKILSFTSLSGLHLQQSLLGLEDDLWSFSYNGKQILKGDIPECVIHLEQLDLDENDVIMSLDPFILSLQVLELQDDLGNWTKHLNGSSKNAFLVYACQKIQEKKEQAIEYYKNMQNLISNILFIHKDLNYEHQERQVIEDMLTGFHHNLHWSALLNELLEKTDLKGIKEISIQYLK
jgi:hypothetical protein